MKRIINKITVFAILLFTFFIPNNKSKATTKASVSSRVNKIRSTVRNEIKKGTLLELSGNNFADKSLKSWVNWGNWANWNNWNNWANWANWNNWRNF